MVNPGDPPVLALQPELGYGRTLPTASAPGANSGISQSNFLPNLMGFILISHIIFAKNDPSQSSKHKKFQS